MRGFAPYRAFTILTFPEVPSRLSPGRTTFVVLPPLNGLQWAENLVSVHPWVEGGVLPVRSTGPEGTPKVETLGGWSQDTPERHGDIGADVLPRRVGRVEDWTPDQGVSRLSYKRVPDRLRDSAGDRSTPVRTRREPVDRRKVVTLKPPSHGTRRDPDPRFPCPPLGDSRPHVVLLLVGGTSCRRPPRGWDNQGLGTVRRTDHRGSRVSDYGRSRVGSDCTPKVWGSHTVSPAGGGRPGRWPGVPDIVITLQDGGARTRAPDSVLCLGLPLSVSLLSFLHGLFQQLSGSFLSLVSRSRGLASRGDESLRTNEGSPVSVLCAPSRK